MRTFILWDGFDYYDAGIHHERDCRGRELDASAGGGRKGKDVAWQALEGLLEQALRAVCRRRASLAKKAKEE